jgi:hypothetical protein
MNRKTRKQKWKETLSTTSKYEKSENNYTTEIVYLAWVTMMGNINIIK